MHQDVLWTASCLDLVTDFDDECASVVIEAVTNSPSVLYVDSIEVVHYDDANMGGTDDIDDIDDD